jgi:hypothetical protein
VSDDFINLSVVTLEQVDALRADYTLSPTQELLWALMREAIAEYIAVRDQIAREGRTVPGRYEGVDRQNPILGHLGTARAHAIRAVRAVAAEPLYPVKDNEDSGID